MMKRRRLLESTTQAMAKFVGRYLPVFDVNGVLNPTASALFPVKKWIATCRDIENSRGQVQFVNGLLEKFFSATKKEPTEFRSKYVRVPGVNLFYHSPYVHMETCIKLHGNEYSTFRVDPSWLGFGHGFKNAPFWIVPDRTDPNACLFVCTIGFNGRPDASQTVFHVRATDGELALRCIPGFAHDLDYESSKTSMWPVDKDFLENVLPRRFEWMSSDCRHNVALSDDLLIAGIHNFENCKISSSSYFFHDLRTLERWRVDCSPGPDWFDLNFDAAKFDKRRMKTHYHYVDQANQRVKVEVSLDLELSRLIEISRDQN